jgi:phage terminase large subunit-like protein
MPKVGSKKFPYTAKGKKAAKAYAMGEKMESKKEKMMEAKKGKKAIAKKAKPKKKSSWRPKRVRQILGSKKPGSLAITNQRELRLTQQSLMWS